MTQLTAWSPYFHSKARMRGRALQLERKVQRLEPEDGELLRAQVQGDELVTVSLKSDGRQAIIECDSAQAAKGEFCEHLWATLLHLVHEPAGPGASVSEVVKLKPQPPKARANAKARAARRARPSRCGWAGCLSCAPRLRMRRKRRWASSPCSARCATSSCRAPAHATTGW
ncbi:hypothetical protein OT109_11245 [Phycisphaeraceae bacterium D3-23]